MVTLEDKLEKVKEEERDLLQRIDARNANRRIPCACCDEAHRIKDVTAIQTYWYVAPHGCASGNYWLPGELQFICPETDMVNRLLFSNYGLSAEERHDIKKNPERQFIAKYRKLFAAVEDERGEPTRRPYHNNYYVDEHRKEFGLVEKIT